MVIQDGQVSSACDNLARAQENILIVRAVDLNDESISASLRAEVAPSDEQLLREAALQIQAEVDEFISELQLLYNAGLKQVIANADQVLEGLNIADSSVEDLLYKIAAEIEDDKLSARFSDPTLSERELLQVLIYATPQQRKEFIRALQDSHSISGDVQDFVKERLDNALHYLSIQERADLIGEFLINNETSAKFFFISNILRASKDLNELRTVVDIVGKNALLAAGDPVIRESLAHCELGPLLRELALSQELTENVSGKEIDSALSSMQQALVQAAHVLDSFPDYTETVVVQDYRAIVANVQEVLNYGFESAITCEDLRSLANTTALRIELGFKYGIKFTDQAPGVRPMIMDGVLVIVESAGRQWSESELRQAKTALGRLCEGMLLTTPLLAELQRVDFLGTGVMAARFGDGVIRVADLAIDNSYVTTMYPDATSLEVVLIHEIGHGIQLGESACAVHSEGLDPLSRGDARYNFDDFLRLSDWGVVDKSRYELRYGNRSVVLDGEEYCLYTPIKHQGKEMVLLYDDARDMLYSVASYAPFSIDRYGRVNPWEDWAVSFAEYHYMPERLITFAPEKFRYFEQEFMVYRDRSDLQERLAQSLAKREQLYAPNETSKLGQSLVSK